MRAATFSALGTIVLVACGGLVEPTPTVPIDPTVPDVGPTPPVDVPTPPPAKPSPRPDPQSPTPGLPATPAANEESWTGGSPPLVGFKGSACMRAPDLVVAPATHVVAIERSSIGPQGNASPPVTVRVEGTAVTLVLSAREPVTWTITLAPGASVARVYVNAAEPKKTSVVGLPAGVPVSVRRGDHFPRGWTRASDDGLRDYVGFLAQVRGELGVLETTFQGTRAAASFTVGGAPPASAIEHYDQRVPCAPCAASSEPTRWSAPGSEELVSMSDEGRLASLTSDVDVGLRPSRGRGCGKHYAEIETSTPGEVGLARPKEIDPIFVDRPTVQVPAAGRVGVAFDLDASTVTFFVRAPSGAVSVQGPEDLGLWYREELAPGIDVTPDAAGGGKVRFVTRAPFFMTPPAGHDTSL